MLRAGNRRYVGGLRRVDAMLSHGRRDDLETQAPVAIACLERAVLPKPRYVFTGGWCPVRGRCNILES